MDHIQSVVDQLYKTHYGKLVSSLLFAFRNIELQSAEDIIQDSFAAALKDWRSNGLPSSPVNWLFKVAQHKTFNKIKQDKRFTGYEPIESNEITEINFPESVLEDQQLKVLFACAHPDLSPKIQVVITLKYVVNLKVEAIAKILAMTVDGVDKLLLRARQKIRDEKMLITFPEHAVLIRRLPIVHKVLYLLFNEGYKSSWGKEVFREELCEDAMLMTKELLLSPISNKETLALYALMLFHHSRFKSRFGPSGDILDLENQDRAGWNKDLIRVATDFLHQSGDTLISTYHIEASIAYIHCTSLSFKETNWSLISKLYVRLFQTQPNPFIELNYSIALYYSGDTKEAFKILTRLLEHPFMNQYYLLNGTLGKFYAMEGNEKSARKHLLKAIQLTNFDLEKNVFQKMIDDLQVENKTN
ncbi:MAG: sigma-70 family RNA polymerase sigma factor [Saprospiraceae bacterium]